MRRLLILLPLLLAACGLTPEGSFLRDTVKAKGTQAYDAGLENAEFFLCEVASVGAVKRRYGGDKAQAYNRLCAATTPDSIVGASP